MVHCSFSMKSEERASLTQRTNTYDSVRNHHTQTKIHTTKNTHSYTTQSTHFDQCITSCSGDAALRRTEHGIVHTPMMRQLETLHEQEQGRKIQVGT